MCKLQNGSKKIYVKLRIIFQPSLFRCNIHKTNVVTLIVITHIFIATRCNTIGVPLLWSFRTKVVVMVLAEHRRSQKGGGRGPGPPPIEMLPMIKTSQKKTIVSSVSVFLASMRTTVINNNINPEGPAPSI